MELLIAAMRKPGLYWWVSPLYKELVPASQIIREWTPPEFIVKKYSDRNVIRYIKLPNGSEIHFHSADKEDSLRGSGLDGLVVDEAAILKPGRWAEELRPSLMDRGGWAIFIGTPKGRNWFYELYLRGKDRAAWPDWESWSMPSSVNPHLAAEEIEAARDGLPELVYRQEILAEFLEGEGTVFRRVDEAVAGALGDAEPDRRYSVGVDLAKTRDFTVLTALDDRGHVRGFDRFNQLDWGFQKRRIAAFAARYPGVAWIDSTGLGDPIYDDLRRAGVIAKSYKFTSASKPPLIENLSLVLDERGITIADDPATGVLVNELKAFAYEMGKTGRIRYGAPEGLHDDCVISLALAAWGQRAGGEIEVLSGWRKR